MDLIGRVNSGNDLFAELQGNGTGEATTVRTSDGGPYIAHLRVGYHVFPYGLVVRIPAFHAGGPGSIPGVGANIVLRRPEIYEVATSFDAIFIYKCTCES